MRFNAYRNRYRSRIGYSTKRSPISKSVSRFVKRKTGSKVIKRLIKSNLSRETFTFCEYLDARRVQAEDVPVFIASKVERLDQILNKVLTSAKFANIKATHTDFGIQYVKVSIIPNSGTGWQTGCSASGHHSIMLDHRLDRVNVADDSLPVNMAVNEFCKLRPTDKTLKMKFSFRKFLKHLNREDRLPISPSESQKADYVKDSPYFRIGAQAFIAQQDAARVPNGTRDFYAICRITVVCDFRGRSK